jgi:hypothetical protein
MFNKHVCKSWKTSIQHMGPNNKQFNDERDGGAIDG